MMATQLQLQQAENSESVILKFLKARQVHTSVPLDVVPVTWIGGGEPNKCMTNASQFVARNPDRFRIVSGWLVHRFDRVRKQQVIEQHWWAFDIEANSHIDPSPDIEQDCIYVEDMDICHFYQLNAERMVHHLRLNNVVFKNGKFVLARWENGRTVSNIARNLSAPSIFHHMVNDGVFREALKKPQPV